VRETATTGGDKTILVLRTYEGKFKYPGEKVSYCPEEAQRMYIDARAKDRAEAEQKAAEKRARPKP
jgi:hypothetical protein